MYIMEFSVGQHIHLFNTKGLCRIEKLTKKPALRKLFKDKFIKNLILEKNNMKGFVILKMCFIFLYFICLTMNIENEISNPCWLSFIRGASSTFCLLAIVSDVIQIVKKKD